MEDIFGNKHPLFALGGIVATPGGLATMRKTSGSIAPAMQMLARHAAGDWGEVDAEDKAANDAAVKDGTRILSAYTHAGVRYWIITEWDRSVTTLLLPSEY